MQDALIKMAFYVSLVLVCPGPTNTLLLSSGLKVGWRATLPLVLAEAAGYAVSISLWGLALLSFATTRPWLMDAIKLASSAYILWLGIKMWVTSRTLHTDESGPVSFRDVFIATLMNPKALLFASTMFPLEAFQSVGYLGRALLVFMIVVAPIGIGWSSLGSLLTSQRSLAAHTSTFLRLASLVLLTFSGSLAYSVLAH
ncbi:LysE family translocator [Ramlibacter sp.]|uniref:LysE family translocator n=1 Tax=Ramlibacter sp. TaxID=1917967 RepID=UPI0025E5C061|nr:LysE family translocator [Ramlibacter sp.]